MTRRPLLLVALFSVVAACASAPARDASAPAPSSAVGAETQATPAAEAPAAEAPAAQEPAPQLVEDSDFAKLVAHERELEALMLGTPDCAKACEHLSALCGLAERICGLALQEPDDELEAHCRDGRSRCERARTRAGQACTCTP